MKSTYSFEALKGGLPHLSYRKENAPNGLCPIQSCFIFFLIAFISVWQIRVCLLLYCLSFHHIIWASWKRRLCLKYQEQRLIHNKGPKISVKSFWVVFLHLFLAYLSSCNSSCPHNHVPLNHPLRAVQAHNAASVLPLYHAYFYFFPPLPGMSFSPLHLAGEFTMALSQATSKLLPVPSLW